MIRFLINIPEKLRNEIKEIAISQGDTLNGLIRQILNEWLNKQNKESR